jgi:hypothetical protein
MSTNTPPRPLGPGAAALIAAEDAEALSLFRRYLTESRVADGADDSNDERWVAALARRDEIEGQIGALRAGPIGLAIKAFLYFRLVGCAGWTPTLETIREDGLSEADGVWAATRLMVSVLRDAAALVPEIGECADAVLHEDASLISAEMGIRWCHDRLGMEPGGPRLHKIQGPPAALNIQAKLEALLDRIGRTEARTPRGEAIKARHAGRAA